MRFSGCALSELKICTICLFVILSVLTLPAAAFASSSGRLFEQQEGDESRPSSSLTAPKSAASVAVANSESTKKEPPPPSVPGLDPKTGIPLYETIQEDWSSLSIGTSKLDPAPPLEAQTDEGESFTRTLVQLQWRPGDPIDVYVVLPKGVKKPPAVLYLYGYKEDTDRFRNNGWAERATRGGVAAIGFVSALTGHRFQNRPLRQWFVSELQESLGSTVHDVHFILDYLAQRGDIDMDHIGMFGQSSGATIALLAAAADPRIKAVDALDPWGDWPDWLAKSPVLKDDPSHTNFTSDLFLAKVAPLDPVKWLPTLTSTSVRLQQIMENMATPDVCKEALRKAAPKQASIIRFEHLNDFSEGAANAKLFDWIKAELKDASYGKASSRSHRGATERLNTLRPVPRVPICKGAND